jgi:hypothetical protein|tara:strand:+ start:522 stop:1073 length:552 start_codon:yes stop_codon:yes gene_type:complete
MGLIINKKINFPGGLDIESFYSRIESYQFHKSVGQLDLIMSHYLDKEGADKALPPYWEDVAENDASATLPFELNVEGEGPVNIPRIISISLTASAAQPVEVWDYKEDWKVVEEEVIDYDDEGNEIKTFDTKKIRVLVSSSRFEEKTKTYDHDFKKDNLIDFAYSKVKNIYNKAFGSENVKDLI